MLLAHNSRYDKYLLMPTEREHSQHEPEIKPDHVPPYRLRFLDRVTPCWQCMTVRSVIVSALALYGLYSLFFL